METPPPESPGVIESLKRFGDAIGGTLRDRFELVQVEVQEEKYRLIQIFIWLSSLIFSGMLAMMFASLTLVYLFWNTARLAVFSGLTAFYAISVTLIILSFKRQRSRDPKPSFKDRLEDIVKSP